MPQTESDPLRRVAVALDTPDREIFSHWCELFGPKVGVLKVGLEAFVRWGPAAVVEARRHAKSVFLDLKLHDIPNTLEGAASAAQDLGVDFLTVHAAGGRRMLEAARRAAGVGVRLLAVTVLTHLGEAELAELDLGGAAEERVHRWAHLARESGCSGVVCSPLELSALRADLPPPFLLATPGIRPSNFGEGDDQRRTASPRAALQSGSDLLIIGRPLTGASDPDAALWELAQEIGQ